jgi:uncharacterized protein with ParB-like and HNH nuclease domain
MAELQVSRKNVAALLSLSDKGTTPKCYIIPEYQRPYSWETDKCDVLWTDIVNFYTALKEDSGAPQEYFLGTVVTCTDSGNPNGIDIIDGQQRITSLLLLLRAFYKQLEGMNSADPKVNGLKTSINPCIWQIERISKTVEDFTKLKIDSRAALDKDNEDFKSILISGKATGSDSNYNKNYKFFLEKCREFAEKYPMDWKELCQTILENCIVLPIECEDLGSALTIFGTLNNRGLPLSDSDIFKAELYKKIDTADEKSAFIDSWKSLEEMAEGGGFTINDIFRYYTHVVRAKNGISDKEIGLRRFYAGNDQKFSLFKGKGFFDNIISLAQFWSALNANVEKFEEDNEFCTPGAIKYVHCLTTYPNDYWRCLVTVYYFKNRGRADFKELFEDFLQRMVAYLFVLFVLKPMVNEVKDPIFKFCIEVDQTGDAVFQKDVPENFDELMDVLSQHQSKMVKPLILLNSYLYNPKQQLITGRLEIEHILPRKWKTANYNGWEYKDANILLESIGNKIPFEKRLNIQAGNNYFGEKKNKYKNSPIIEVQDLSQRQSDDWLKEDIEARRKELCDRLIGFFNDKLHPAIAQAAVEVIFNVRKDSESIMIESVTSGSLKTFRMTTVKSVDKKTLSLQQVLSNNIPVEKKTVDYENLKTAVLNLDKEILAGAEVVKSCDEINTIMQDI